MEKKSGSNNEKENLVKEAQKLMEEKGKKALKLAEKIVLNEKIECKEIKEALRYFITTYWQDLARPTLISLCCEAVGGSSEVTTPFAVSLSLISGAIDIHDDIIDDTKIKFKKPTIYGRYGREVALLISDALLFKGFILLCEACTKISSKKAKKIMDLINATFYELGDAEALELDFRGKLNIDLKKYLKVIEKKAADVEAHTRIGAILGDGTEEEINALGRFGRLLGMIILVRDDYIDALNPTELLVRIKKESPPLAFVYSMQKPQTREIFRNITRYGLTKKSIKKVIDIIEEAGGFRYQLQLLNQLFEKATRELKILKTNKELRKFLQATCLF